MKNHLLLIILSLSLLVCCQRENLSEDDSVSGFEAFTEEFFPDTKTQLSEARNIVWTAGDEIIVYEGGTQGNVYRLNESSEGTSNASFVMSGGRAQGYVFDANLALYPSSFVNSMSYSDGAFTLDVTIPAEQDFSNGTFASGSFPMTALTSSKGDNRLKFKNVFGAVRLNLKGDEMIKSIIFRGNSDEILAGDAVIVVDGDENLPSIKMAEDGMTEVVMDCGEGVQLSPYKATEFVFSLPPYEFESGFEFVVSLADGTEKELKTEKANHVLRSSILDMPVCKVDGTIVEGIAEPVFEITDMNVFKMELTANLGEVEYFLGGQHYQFLSETSDLDFDTNVALAQMNEICAGGNPKDNLTRNEYPFGFVGDPGEFLGTFKWDYLPMFKYTLWVVPYVEGKTNYTEEDIIWTSFDGPKIKHGGTLALQPESSLTTTTNIQVTFKADGAVAICYAWVKEDEIQGLDDSALLDIIISGNCFIHSETLDYYTMPDETVVLLAAALDPEGRAGEIYKEKFTTLPYYFNDMEVSVDVHEEIDITGGSFNITVSKPAYGYFSILIPSWWSEYTDPSDIDRWMISNVGGGWDMTYTYDTQTPSESFEYQHNGQLELGVEYTFFVMAKDAEGKYSHNATYSFYPRPDETYSSNWSIIGYFNDWNGDLMMEESGNYYVYKNFTLEPQYSEEGDLLPLEFKFRNDCSWNIDIGADGFFTHELSVPYQTAFRGQNIVVPDYGTYDIYLSKYLNKYYIMPQGAIPSDYVTD